MYGPKKTNINVHKAFHPGSGKNRERVENAQAAQAQKKVDAAARTAQLEREQLQDKYDAIQSTTATAAGSGPRGVVLPRRLALFVDSAAEQQPSRPQPSAESSKKTMEPSHTTPTVEENDAKATGAKVVTGVVSREEAATSKKDIEDARKARNDPLSRIIAHEKVVAGKALAAGTVPTASSSSSLPSVAPLASPRPTPTTTTGSGAGSSSLRRHLTSSAATTTDRSRGASGHGPTMTGSSSGTVGSIKRLQFTG